MADFTSNAPMRARPSNRGWEYRVYFVPILAVSLPLAVARAAIALVTSDPTPRAGILKDGWDRAHEVTATICSV